LDVECGVRKATVPNQEQSVEELYPAKDYKDLPREPTEEDLQWLRNSLLARFTGMAYVLELDPERPL
jgi:hypothetical protein